MQLCCGVVGETNSVDVLGLQQNQITSMVWVVGMLNFLDYVSCGGVELPQYYVVVVVMPPMMSKKIVVVRVSSWLEAVRLWRLLIGSMLWGDVGIT